MALDNLEYISIEKQTTNFPKHYHETFCISLIHNGIEKIDFDHQSLFSEKGSISITNPYEIHANPLIDAQTPLTFDTIYLSNDLMTYLLNGKNIRFVNRKINNKQANQMFIQLKNAINTGDAKIMESYLSPFVHLLKHYSEKNNDDFKEENPPYFKDINHYIEYHIYEKFCLEELSKMAHINKYGFIKKFKSATGMTPMNYVLMKKIFSCKRLIQPDSELTEIAYQYNFTDLAHFSKTFKRFIGISPKKYQEQYTNFT